jgi:hypothetical protein
MCGPNAIVEFEPGDQLRPCLLSRHRCIPHRGPDGEDFALLDSALTASARGGNGCSRSNKDTEVEMISRPLGGPLDKKHPIQEV